MRITKGKQFEKQYEKLPAKTQKQFIVRLKLFLDNKDHPLLHVHSLTGKYQGLYSFNVTADMRVIYDDSYDDTIILVYIGSHSELYR
jgi:addiction module RelE/StbE family toxin